ncbi:MAG: hypothetical protein KID09_25230, partial [Paenibacillus macerans]|uniref:hypothetical protein n=1 Tax=Paenibacillus macerans TaxID=44252 RepID=UPI002432AEBA
VCVLRLEFHIDLGNRRGRLSVFEMAAAMIDVMHSYRSYVPGIQLSPERSSFFFWKHAGFDYSLTFSVYTKNYISKEKDG